MCWSRNIWNLQELNFAASANTEEQEVYLYCRKYGKSGEAEKGSTVA